ncbi:MAG TPA: hypothetical protein VFB02_05890 [Bradyrhizobium sp.]|nr:hypothetical protein [Bradyrhizobium sp.]
MSMHGIDTSAPLWNVTGARARAMLQLFRQQMLAFAQVPHPEVASAARHAAAPPSARPSLADLPAELQQLLKRYEAAHPGVRVELVSYLTYGAPGDRSTEFNMSDLPPDDSLVVLAVTETVASAKQVEVRSHVLVAHASGE